MRLFFATTVLILGWLAALPDARGFALLGPYAPWMTPNLGYPPHRALPGSEIGGPMGLGEEYRWTLPVVTYGFDQSFLDCFGQPGVDTVERAIRVLNNLPPASDLVPTNWRGDVWGISYRAYSGGLYDLQSATLALLLEQMGLAQATRYVWTIRRWDPGLFCPANFYFLDETAMSHLIGLSFTNYVENRGYDPESQQPTRYVNTGLYTFWIYGFDIACTDVEAVPFAVDPFQSSFRPVSDRRFEPSLFCTGLSRDDVGGFLYLLNRTNINVETLDASIVQIGDTNASGRTAPRPGVEKIVFVRHATNVAGQFVALTNQFGDEYFSNGVVLTQLVQRVILRPDFLFQARDFGYTLASNDPGQPVLACPTNWVRTDTSRWLNNADLNDNPGGDGPGVIRPPIEITFHTPGRYVALAGGGTQGTNYSLWNWGSFDSSTNPPVVFRGNLTNETSLTLSTRTFVTNGTPTFEWTLFGRDGGRYRIEASLDLSAWTTNAVLTNAGGIFRFTCPVGEPPQFFRAVLEE